MTQARYRLLITGELEAGYSVDSVVPALAMLFDTPEEQLAGLFDGKGPYPIDEDLSAEQALELQVQLGQIGVRSSVERRAPLVQLKLRNARPLAAAKDSEPAPGTPKIEQEPIDSVVVDDSPKTLDSRPRANLPPKSVGLIDLDHFDKLDRDFEQEDLPEDAALERHHGGSLEPADEEALSVWDQDDVTDEEARLGLFVGEEVPKYLELFERFELDGHSRFRPGWNWGAFVQPFLWALYRKMWLWALLMFVTSVLLPVSTYVAGSFGIISERLIELSYLLLAANMVFWAAVGDYLYYRHAHAAIKQITAVVPAYSVDLEIAAAGGVSRSALLVGATFSAVLALFIWSVTDSLLEKNAEAPPVVIQKLDGEPGEEDILEDQRITTPNAEEETKWSASRKRLRAMGQAINQWLSSYAENKDPASVTLFRLREDIKLAEEDFLDGWGTEFNYVPDTESYRLISAGPDRLFGTADDLQYRPTDN